MFDISFSELLVVGAIALIVIGPARLPGVARTVGHLLGRAQRYVNDVKADIRREVELDELRKLKEQMNAAAQEVQTSVQAGEAALRETQTALQANIHTAADIPADIPADTPVDTTADTTAHEPAPAPTPTPAPALADMPTPVATATPTGQTP